MKSLLMRSPDNGLFCCVFRPNLDTAFWWYAAGFILFRLFDILKPWPVSSAERLPDGIGVMADDLVAGTLAGMAILVAQLFIYSP